MTDRALSVSSLLGEILHTYSCCIHNSYRMIPVYLQPYDIICLDMKIYAQLSTSSELASFSGKPFPVKIHVSQWSNRPGGPIRLQSSTLCDVKIPLFSPSNHIHLPTKRSHVKTWLHSSDTKFGYYHVMYHLHEWYLYSHCRSKVDTSIRYTSYLHHSNHCLLRITSWVKHISKLWKRNYFQGVAPVNKINGEKLH